jgi:hypothetical protein
MNTSQVNRAIAEYQCPGCVCELYQCPGCVCGHSPDICANFKGSLGCANHCASTFIPPIGLVFLGMPKGFNQLGPFRKMRPFIYKDFKEFLKVFGGYDDVLNIPFWKYVNNKGHLFVRGFMPKVNSPFIHIILKWEIEDIESINCKHIKDEDLERMS